MNLSYAEDQRKFALVIGGGGSPPGKKTIFDKAFSIQAQKLKKAGFISTLVYNGGHSNLESIASKYFSSPRQDMTLENVKNSINQFIKDIRSGKFRKGDEILVSVFSHGYPKSDDSSTHEIMTNDQVAFNMDELVTLRDEAERAGIKLAILDQSCYSGNSLKLATPKTCVISAADDHNVALGSDIENFWNSVSPEKSLEDVYLEARLDTHLPTSPAISSSVGATAKQVMSMINQNLASGYEAWKKIHLKTSLPSDDINCNSLAGIPRYKNLADLTRALQVLIPELYLSDNTENGLSQTIKEFQKASYSVNTLGEKELSYGETVEEIESIKWTWDALVNFDFNSTKREYEDWVSCPSCLPPIKREYYLKVLATLDKVEERRKKLLSNNDFKTYLKLRKELVGSTAQIDSIVTKLAKEERKLYNKIYRTLNLKNPNPCKEFKF